MTHSFQVIGHLCILLHLKSSLVFGCNNITICFLLNDQLDAQFFSVCLFTFLHLYMFRAHPAHHQERQIVSIQPLVAVTLRQWPCRVQVGSSLPTCTRHDHWRRV